jgi:hypothetical protein
MTSRDDLREWTRALQALWGTLLGGPLVALLATAAALAAGFAPSRPPAGDALFYLNGLGNTAALAWAFAVQHQTRLAVRRAREPADRLAHAYTLARRGLPPLAAAALFACVAALASGAWVHLAFLLPVIGFAILFYPTDARVGRWLARPAEHSPEP